jgi:hypothetical protein
MQNRKGLLKFKKAVNGKSVQVEELLTEIDNLAVLLHRVREQTDKIEAAADAIGDSLLNRLHNDTPASVASRRDAQRVESTQPNGSVRM